jgi:transposase
MERIMGQWPKRRKVLDDDRLPLDDRLRVNAIRPPALGRKNYLFAGSQKGANRLAMMHSFLGCCEIQGLDQTAWLGTRTDHIQTWPVKRLEELLPSSNHIEFRQEPSQQ